MSNHVVDAFARSRDQLRVQKHGSIGGATPPSFFHGKQFQLRRGNQVLGSETFQAIFQTDLENLARLCFKPALQNSLSLRLSRTSINPDSEATLFQSHSGLSFFGFHANPVLPAKVTVSLAA